MGDKGSAPRVKPCSRCGHWHGQTMVTVVRSGVSTRRYRAAHVQGAVEWPRRRDAEIDQCDAWAKEVAS